MIIHNETIEILKNFAEINQSLVIEQGDVVKTVSEQTNVMAKADLEQSFPQDFAIYDLNKFLGVLSLFAEPQFDFSEKSVRIQSSVDANNFVAGDSVAEYQFANMSLFENERKILQKDIELPTIDASFKLEEKYLVSVMRAASVMSLPEIAVVAKGGKITMQSSAYAGICNKSNTYCFCCHTHLLTDCHYNYESYESSCIDSINFRQVVYKITFNH